MKLSIFPQANAHPVGPDEKKLVTYQVSKPNLPTTVEFDTDDELTNFVTTFAWSPFVFSGHRHADNFVSCDLLVYDIDDGLTIDAAKIIIENADLSCLCLPSPSHSEELHKFRIIIPLARTIYDPEVYFVTWLSGAELFGVVDPSCKDVARFYNGSTMADGFWNEGTLFEPTLPQKKMEHSPAESEFDSSLMLPVGADISELVRSIYGEDRNFVPEAVDFFLRNAKTGLPGQWINALNRFCFSLALSEVADDVILALCKQLAPNELDRKDMYQINRAISDAKKV